MNEPKHRSQLDNIQTSLTQLKTYHSVAMTKEIKETDKTPQEERKRHKTEVQSLKPQVGLASTTELHVMSDSEQPKNTALYQQHRKTKRKRKICKVSSPTRQRSRDRICALEMQCASSIEIAIVYEERKISNTNLPERRCLFTELSSRMTENETSPQPSNQMIQKAVDAVRMHLQPVLEQRHSFQERALEMHSKSRADVNANLNSIQIISRHLPALKENGPISKSTDQRVSAIQQRFHEQQEANITAMLEMSGRVDAWDRYWHT